MEKRIEAFFLLNTRLPVKQGIDSHWQDFLSIADWYVHGNLPVCPLSSKTCVSDWQGGTAKHPWSFPLNWPLSISPDVQASTFQLCCGILWRLIKLIGQHLWEGGDQVILISYHLSPGFFQLPGWSLALEDGQSTRALECSAWISTKLACPCTQQLLLTTWSGQRLPATYKRCTWPLWQRHTELSRAGCTSVCELKGRQRRHRAPQEGEDIGDRRGGEGGLSSFSLTTFFFLGDHSLINITPWLPPCFSLQCVLITQQKPKPEGKNRKKQDFVFGHWVRLSSAWLIPHLNDYFLCAQAIWINWHNKGLKALKCGSNSQLWHYGAEQPGRECVEKSTTVFPSAK